MALDDVGMRELLEAITRRKVTSEAINYQARFQLIKACMCERRVQLKS